MIKEFKSILNKDELKYLQNKCDSFIKNNQTIPDGKNWFYNSMHLYGESDLDNLNSKLLEIVGKNYEIQYNGIFINKVTSETNKGDDYHQDQSDLTIVTYLNEDYMGGEFEYILDNKVSIIKPQINLSIMMDKKTPHRVLPVIEGVRYSLIVWFKNINKNII